MKMRHTASWWLAVAALAALSLFTLSEAWGQSPGSQAAFEGRPALGGAQAGTGAMAGPPQGGLGVQDDTRKVLPRKDESGLPSREPEDARRTRPGGTAVPQRDRDPGVAKPGDDDARIATPQRRARDKVTRGARNTRDAARHGVSPIGMQ